MATEDHADEPVTAPDQHKPAPIKWYRLGGILLIVSLVAMLFGNNDTRSAVPWILGTAAIIAIWLILDAYERRSGLKD